MKGNPVKKLLRFLPAIMLVSGSSGSYAAVDTETQDIVTILEAGSSRESAVSPAVTGTNTVTVNTKDLESGIYLLHIYARGNDGTESVSVTRLVYVAERETAAGAEYFVDSDPGAGKAHTLNVGEGGLISFSVPTGNLETGLHTLYVRSRDASFNWSDVVSRNFLVIRNSLGIEWFYDKDPGIGRANQAEPDESGVVLLPTIALEPGVHTLSIRSRDIAGNWSATVTHPLYVTEPYELKACEYYIDKDPGTGNGTQIAFAGNGTASFAIPTAGLSSGMHTLSIRGKDDTGEWYPILAAPFNVTVDSGVGNISWIMDVKVSRENGSVVLEAENIDPGCHVEVVTVDGIVVYSGIWSDTDSPLEISLDTMYRNCILNIISPDGRRLVRRIR